MARNSEDETRRFVATGPSETPFGVPSTEAAPLVSSPSLCKFRILSPLVAAEA